MKITPREEIKYTADLYDEDGKYKGYICAINDIVMFKKIKESETMFDYLEYLLHNDFLPPAEMIEDIKELLSSIKIPE